MERLRMGVFGVGNMGRHHVRILAAMADVDLVAIIDPDLERAARLAHLVGAGAFGSLDEAPAMEAAVVAVPTSEHLEVATRLMDRGISLLIEKPLAATSEEAARILEASLRAGVTVGVGHVERFNPVVRVLSRIVSGPRLLQFERLSPYTPRVRESVVFDLMVHDLDLACLLVGATPRRVLASGTSVFSDTLDVASAILEFPDGAVASLQASRATQDKVRRIAVSEKDRFLTADCVRQDVSIKRETAVAFADEDEALYRQASVVEIPYLDRRGEPLALELEDFVQAVRQHRAPHVDGQAGLRAVQLASAVETAARPSLS